MNWWHIDISGPEPEVLEGVLALHGAEGILTLSQNQIRGFFQATQTEIDSIAHLLSDFSPKVESVHDKNWVQECEDLLVPLTVDALTITPIVSSESSHPTSASEIFIIPGMGFGTGHHETTSSVLKLMQKLSFHPKSVFDFGAGSGILTIAASKLWPDALIEGVEIDEAAVQNARENCTLNGISGGLIRHGDSPTVGNRYELVLSNLYAEALIENAKDLLAVCENTMILSGILREKASEVFEVFSRLGARLTHQETQNKWCTMQWSNKDGV